MYWRWKMLHEDIAPFSVDIEEMYLYDMDKKFKGKYTPGRVFGISSYPEEALTFQVLLNNGSLFSYLPLNSVRKPGIRSKTIFELSDLVYKNCPGSEVVVKSYIYLEGMVNCYFKNKDIWMSGKYMTTVDWFKDNEQFHLISLENGQYAALPNHKVKFKNEERVFKSYKKLHKTWEVK